MGKNVLATRNLLISLLLLVLTLPCETIDNESSKGKLPKQEVHAINVLLGHRKNKLSETPFSEIDCNERYKSQVTCRCQKGTCGVTILDFSSLDIRGGIPEEIANLSSLTSLHLSSNRLGKEIPSSFEKLLNLAELVLDDNLLEGRIPTFLGRMKSLQFLILSNNMLSGELPSDLGNLSNLQYLDLHNNQLSGELPTQLGNLNNLQGMDLSNNLLLGELPSDLGYLSNLQYLSLYDNHLSGKLPIQLGNLSNLQAMSLDNNNFSGNLPSTFERLKNMSIFFINGNNFDGKVPSFIAHWNYLRVLHLEGNNFEWPSSPEVFQSLANLETLNLAGLTGGPREKSDFLFLNASLHLRSLDLRHCSLGGQIPDFVWQLPSLEYLDLSFNNLIGEIPSFVGLNLRNLYLRGNKLNKSATRWFTNLINSHVDISENRFTNLTLPPSNISKNWNLFSCCTDIKNENEAWKNAGYHCYNGNQMNDQLHINCGGDPTTVNATLYEADSQPYGESTFFLSPNKKWGYSSMGVSNHGYILNKTCDVNMVDAPLYTTARISSISLKYFGFCLKNGNYTVKLHFAEISWNPNKEHKKGPNNEGMRIFDVEIQGIKQLTNFNIIKDAGGVNKDTTKEFNVSVNNNLLEIHLYETGKGSLGSSGLQYTGPLISAISVFPAPVHNKKLSTPIIVGIVASALLVPILILTFLWKLGWLGSKAQNNEELKGIELLPNTFFNFRQIKAATQNFSSANKLGEGGFGSVYKGVLPNGTTIAIKQLSAKSRQGIREFVNEVGTISALQHPNLVRLLGCCAEDNQLLLVYEYMENNSLAHALFGPGELKTRLNWPTRVKICLGIAKGLAFLHEESKLKIVHRDIKPTNILLSSDFNAKISDFGFAKLYEGEMTHVVTKIAGTTGYMAPEYAMRGHLTSKADVYSFGVVTLEIISGKNSTSYRPNDENVYLLDLAYVLQQKGNLIELVDPTLGSDYSSVQAIAILELAMLCTNLSPSLRPTMSEVVKALEGKGQIVATPVNAPYSMDDLAMVKDMVDFSHILQEGTSNTNSSQAINKDVEK